MKLKDKYAAELLQVPGKMVYLWIKGESVSMYQASGRDAGLGVTSYFKKEHPS